jgi:hypothetical protein
MIGRISEAKIKQLQSSFFCNLVAHTTRLQKKEDYSCLKLMWFCQKTKTWDDFVCFPHLDDWWNCPYHSLATQFVLLETPNKNLFPHANDATIGKLINKQLRLIEIQYNADKSYEKLRYFTKAITTHSFRRYAINKMENKGLSPDWIDSRAGFERNHTTLLVRFQEIRILQEHQPITIESMMEDQYRIVVV